MSSDYIWPLSKSPIPNEMNTSFGPRINTTRWDFHDGSDPPAEKGTKIYAMRDGTVLFAGAKDKDGYSSRHIVLEVDDPNDGLMYLVHLHLDSIDGALTPGAKVVQGQEIGTVGDGGATYPHLHIEFLQDTPDPKAQTSRHPLRYLPYSDTANFTAPLADRFNRFGPRMAARLLFGACEARAPARDAPLDSLNRRDTCYRSRFSSFPSGVVGAVSDPLQVALGMASKKSLQSMSQ